MFRENSAFSTLCATGHPIDTRDRTDLQPLAKLLDPTKPVYGRGNSMQTKPQTHTALPEELVQFGEATEQTADDLAALEQSTTISIPAAPETRPTAPLAPVIE